MNCINCEYFDATDYMNGWGTCEPQDEDFPAVHECNMSEREIALLECLTGHSR